MRQEDLAHKMQQNLGQVNLTSFFTDGAPDASSLIVKNLTATITMPTGEDQVAGTDATPGDDPLRMAKGASGYFKKRILC